MKPTKPTSLLILLYIIFFTFEPLIVSAGLFSSLFGGGASGDARSGIKGFIEDDLNINVEESLKPMTEGINSASNKGSSAEVSIRFTTPNPKPGEKITASADVTGISNIQDAYYFWYLKNPKREPQGELAEQHIAAVRAQAKIYFDPLTFDQTFNGGNNNGSYEEEYPEDTDDDGFKAPLGGGNTRGNGKNFCYVADPISGIQYEIAKEGRGENGCPDGYEPRCMMDDKTLQCPVNVEGVEGIFNTQENTQTDNNGDTTSDSSTTGEISGGGGVRSKTVLRCLDNNSPPRCNKQDRLYCRTTNGKTNVRYKYKGRIKTPTPFCVKIDKRDHNDCRT